MRNSLDVDQDILEVLHASIPTTRTRKSEYRTLRCPAYATVPARSSDELAAIYAPYAESVATSPGDLSARCSQGLRRTRVLQKFFAAKSFYTVKTPAPQPATAKSCDRPL